MKVKATADAPRCPDCKHAMPNCPLGHELHCRKIGCKCKACIATILA